MIHDSTQNPENLKQDVLNRDKSFAIKKINFTDPCFRVLKILPRRKGPDTIPREEYLIKVQS